MRKSFLKKSYLFFLLLTVAWSHGVLAATSSSDENFNQVYIAANKVKTTPVGWSQNLGAVVMVAISGGGYKDLCTATQISTRGHLLLNLHCLTDCLAAQPQTLPGASKGFTNPPVLYNFDSRSVGRQCEISLGSSSQKLKATVMALGRGYINHRNIRNGFKINRGLFYSWLENDADDNDYAILKVSGLKGSGCARLASNSLSLNDKVWCLAYPGKTTRSDGSKIPGEQKLFTSGYVRTVGVSPPSPSDNQCSTDEALPVNFGRGLFTSSLDVAPGASGAAIFNERGEIAGLLRGEGAPVDHNCNVICPAETCPYRDGMAMAIDIQTILENVRQNFGDQVVNESFNCQ